MLLLTSKFLPLFAVVLWSPPLFWCDRVASRCNVCTEERVAFSVAGASYPISLPVLNESLTGWWEGTNS